MEVKDLTDLLKISNQLIENAKSPQEAYSQGLAMIGKSYRWPVGHVYVTNDADSLLVSSKIWFLSHDAHLETFRRITESTTFKIGEGLPGRVLKSKTPQWIIDVTQDSNFPRARQARDIGVKAAFAFPIIVRTKVIAVWEFYAKEAYEPDSDLLVVIDAVSSQISRALERFLENEYRDIADKIAVKSEEAVKEVENELANFSETHRLVEQGMNNITEIVSDIDLVSLNARIESAKMGEHAARFNVVANEISKMSEKMKLSSTQIKDNLMVSQQNNLNLLKQIRALTSLLNEVKVLKK
ncbi:MAG: GAF domain-containing protein [Bacteroidota bacterium]